MFAVMMDRLTERPGRALVDYVVSCSESWEYVKVSLERWRYELERIEARENTCGNERRTGLTDCED